MSLFIPKRLLIKPQSKHSKITQEIIARTQRYDPGVAIEYLKTPDFVYPVATPREKFLYMKESAIVSERSEDFIRTFDSPGNIVESLTTVLNLSWMCANNCEFCYLQTNQTPEHYFYTNLEKAEHEIASSPAAHAAILTLWTHLSHYFGTRLIKLPDRFKETADWIRELFVGAHVMRDSEAIDRYFLGQDRIIAQLNKDNSTFKIDPSRFKRDRAAIKEWYSNNLKYPLTLTASEFNDFLAVDHLTDNSAFLMSMVQKYPRFKFTIRSRSSYVDGFLRYDGQDRARFNITLSPDYAIKEFEHGTATLDERIHAARRVQEAKGFALSLVFEPILTYAHYLEDYKQLIRRALTELDPSRIQKIILGSARYSDQLKGMVRMHFPGTKLFDTSHELIPPKPPDTKNRYDPEVRRGFYSELIAEIRSLRNIPIALGSETPGLWESLGMNTDEELGNRVHEQLTEKSGAPVRGNSAEAKKTESALTHKQPEMPIRGDDMEPEAQPESDAEESLPYWNAIAPQDLSLVESIIAEYDDYVPLDQLETVVNELRQMATVIEVPEEGREDINDRWQIEEAQSLTDLLARDVYFHPVKIVGRISRVNPVVAFELPKSGTTSISGIEIVDTQGTAIETLDFQAMCVMTDLGRLYRDRTRCTFLGAIVPFFPKKKTKKDKPKPRFYLHDITTDVNPIDLVPWTPAEEDTSGFGVVVGGKRYGIPRDHPYSILRAHPETNGIINYIKQELSHGLGIQALDEAHELERALEFVILQALSQGRSNILEKLHGLIIGPPNVGKSYLTRAALILNTVGQEISSSGRKVTVAGLVGTVKPKSKKNVSEPGILPSNNDGIVCIQEFHEVRAETRKAVCGLFVRMMEEGQVVESTSAATVHPTETALLLDMNRYSQIDPSHAFNSFSDIDIPVNMLARFDYIVEIPRDEKRSKQIAEQMAGSFEVMGGTKPTDTELWMLRLKYLVAFLKTEYKVISFPEDVRNHLQSRTTAMLAEIPPELQGLVEDMRLRIVRSAFKITKAVTVANASREATREYAEYAMRFVQDKVNYIRSIKPDDIAVEIAEERPNIDDAVKRREIIDAEFRGMKFGIDQVMEFLQDQMEGECNKRTIQRDLKDLGAKPLKKPKGSWSLA